jgi:hypothetical protein
MSPFPSFLSLTSPYPISLALQTWSLTYFTDLPQNQPTPSLPQFKWPTLFPALATLFPLPLSYLAIAQKQHQCPSILSLQSSSSLSITSIPLSSTDSLLSEVSTNTFKPLIPETFHKLNFYHIHSLDYPEV